MSRSARMVLIVWRCAGLRELLRRPPGSPPRMARPVARQVAHGRSPAAVLERATRGIDAADARLVLGTAARGDVVVALS
ncbi:hypothetical protein [Arsenicicoccus dermatophilus]|uniref:hypothetical protein n=1 Tax=Arsenicicoccus dermatophilus TaxID=1076331 RepID=UPI001F4C7B08|nr:hypothetical protein [Arsenicicoccus dermatophilus]MCH8614004.1 hypothetical protein [Arsenicicoccus dermatophilus]